jgi:hypothetical protein
MSFLTRFATTARIAAPLSTARATPSVAAAGQRFVSSTAKREKGPVDATKSTLKKADRVVSDAAVKGIETGGMFFLLLTLLDLIVKSGC